MNNALVKIVLEGGGMEQISHELCDTIQNPVLILDQERNCSVTDRQCLE